MPDTSPDPKKPRRVSFALPNSSNSSNSANPRPSPRPNPRPSPHPDSRPDSRSDDSSGSCPGPGPTATFDTHPDTLDLSGAFTHTVTNTPHGLVIDGVLQPRGPGAHSVLSDPPPQPQPRHPVNCPLNPSAPHYHCHNPQPFNMSTVGAGFMPDPNAVHYQPPVPDTTNGPFQYTYVPRSDPVGPQYVMANGAVAGLPFYGPTPYQYQQVQPGLATAPIPMVPQCPQPHPMQFQPMQAQPFNLQPGAIPPMAYPMAPAANVPTYVVSGTGPTPPVTPPTPGFGGNPAPMGGGYEFGKTKTEVEAENRYNALHNQMNEPQDMKPGDDDVARMYWCHEPDGNWIPRNRYSIDHMGHFRWYVTKDGVFYAKNMKR
ncbi:hypothetical protein F5Y19DRAFT_469599 [Xylariaceae sp. FL1651]|nr:hypothetical protein F5Y19DRAFT_469599 [Xylariaceae sp. FL1651]